MNIFDFKKKKLSRQKISMLTCYDYTSARLASETSVDMLLVGDSLAMTMYGHNSTLPATVEIMALHTSAVVRGASQKFVVADLPFLSYRKDLNENVTAVDALMKAGAHAVKLEGAAGNENLIRHLVESGVPVMGHIGLTPQSLHQLGGYRVQGREAAQAQMLLDAAVTLEQNGCFAVVLECVPSALARTISERLEIPTIGIGAGPDTDGQVLVWQDVLGMNTDFKPKFVRSYLDGKGLIQSALAKYISDVERGEFPSPQESYE